jgi:hypothetical protein
MLITRVLFSDNQEELQINEANYGLQSQMLVDSKNNLFTSMMSNRGDNKLFYVTSYGYS